MRLKDLLNQSEYYPLWGEILVAVYDQEIDQIDLEPAVMIPHPDGHILIVPASLEYKIKKALQEAA